MANASLTQEAPTTRTIGSQSISGTLLQVLVVEARPECGHALRDGYTPINEHTVAGAKRRLADLRPQIVVTDLVLSDGNGVDVCRMAKALAHPPLVIVTPTTAEQVPAALKAGCDAVLLRPFSPNLLCARIGRLRQLSHRAVTTHRAVHREDIAVNVYLSNDASVTTNHLWNEIACPRCNRRGATGFDFVSRRRMWCACLSCDHVWIARRLE